MRTLTRRFALRSGRLCPSSHLPATLQDGAALRELSINRSASETVLSSSAAVANFGGGALG
jgi:hypothetical protein